MQKQAVKPIQRKSENKLPDEAMLILIGIAAYTATFLLSCTLSLIFDFDGKTMVYVALGAFSLAAFLSGFVTGRKKRKNGLLNGVVYSLPATVLFIFISLCVNGFSCDLNLIFSITLMLIFSALGGVLSVNTKKKSKIKRR